MADILLETKVTDTNGHIAFTTPLGPGHYYTVMTGAPTGYNGSSTQNTFTVTNATPVVQNLTATPSLTSSIQVTKHVSGNTSQVLPGGTFSLVHTDTGKTLVTESAPSDANGHVVFNSLMTMNTPSEQTYAIQEVTAPSGYTADPTAHSQALTPSVQWAVNVPDTPNTTSTAAVNLADVTYSVETLPGSTYELHWTTP